MIPGDRGKPRPVCPFALNNFLEATIDITHSKTPEDIGKKRANMITLWYHYILVSIYRRIVDLCKLTIILIARARTKCNMMYTRTGKSTSKVDER